MPTTVESRLARVEDRVEQMWEWINGGPSRRHDDSARGRIHRLMNDKATSEYLAEALREVRRERSRQWTRAEKLGLFVFAALAALAPYIVLLTR